MPPETWRPMTQYGRYRWMDPAGDCVPRAPDDALAVKIVAVVGGIGDWAAYWGPSHWSDERVASEGHKLPARQAEPLFPSFAGRRYRQ